MVGKKSGKALLREEGQKLRISVAETELTSCTGLERTDNNMEHNTWPVIGMINQKNYYT